MKEMNKNILLVSTNGKLTNGASQCVLMIANEMKKRGINIVLALIQQNVFTPYQVM